MIFVHVCIVVLLRFARDMDVFGRLIAASCDDRTFVCDHNRFPINFRIKPLFRRRSDTVIVRTVTACRKTTRHAPRRHAWPNLRHAWLHMHARARATSCARRDFGDRRWRFVDDGVTATIMTTPDQSEMNDACRRLIGLARAQTLIPRWYPHLPSRFYNIIYHAIIERQLHRAIR